MKAAENAEKASDKTEKEKGVSEQLVLKWNIG